MTDDPFDFDDDRTVMRPRSAPARPEPSSSGAQRRSSFESNHQPAPLSGSINALEHAASRLLPLIITIKNTSSHSNPTELRNKLIRELEEFKSRAKSILNDQKKVTQASYVMCTALDEAVMNTPWGHEANWAQTNLLSTFHNEVGGGERFFALLKALSKNPKENIDLLELMYVCLSLGYEGSYRIARNGQETLTKVRMWLHDIIRSHREQPGAALSQNWKGSNFKQSKLPKMTPLWVGAAACLAIASGVYIGAALMLGSKADSVVTSFLGLKAQPLTIAAIEPPAAPIKSVTPSFKPLSAYLQSEIAANELEVFEEFDNGKIRLIGDNLFGSGKAAINASMASLIQRAASAMNNFDGGIVVTGHSDNVPIRSAKFPSNIALSQKRAESVLDLLAGTVTEPGRLLAEGKGSLEPIADNGSAGGRALNRRVEITVYY